MENASEYQAYERRAEAFELLADQASYPPNRASLLAIAGQWRSQAEDAKRRATLLATG
jgi:hypothetical protein